nr:hypothetical protein [Pandoravirus massiliensis]
MPPTLKKKGSKAQSDTVHLLACPFSLPAGSSWRQRATEWEKKRRPWWEKKKKDKPCAHGVRILFVFFSFAKCNGVPGGDRPARQLLAVRVDSHGDGPQRRVARRRHGATHRCQETRRCACSLFRPF